MSGWADRGSRHARGYGQKWVKLRATILKRDRHLCQPCLRTGRVTAATAVDHITAKAKGGTDDPANLEATCDPCHADKTARDAGRTLKPKVRIGADGWPIREPRGGASDTSSARPQGTGAPLSSHTRCPRSNFRKA